MQRSSFECRLTGPIDAFFARLASATVQAISVLDYHEHSIGAGADARAIAYLELRVNDRTLFGVGTDADIVAASLKAILSGFQRAQSWVLTIPADVTAG